MAEENKSVKLEVNPEIAKITTPEEIETLKNFLINPKEGVNDESRKVVLSLIDKAAEVFGEDLVKETLNYLSAARRGLHIADLAQLVGESWDNDKFQKVTVCFGIPLVGAMNDVLVIPSQDVRALLFNSLSDADKVSFHSDIAYRLMQLAENDPLHITETMHHLLRSEQPQQAAAFFAQAKGQTLNASAGAIGYLFAAEKGGEQTIAAILDAPVAARFDLYRRFINEVFIMIMQNSRPEVLEKFITMVESKLTAVMGEKSTIDNILLLALTSLRIASVKLHNKDIESVKKYFEKGLGLMDNLLAQVPDAAKAFTWENIEGLFNLGLISIDLRQPKAAAHCFDNAFKVALAKLKLEESELRKSFVASWYLNVCRIFIQIKDKEDGAPFFNQGKLIMKEVIKDKIAQASAKPEEPALDRDVMVMYNDLGDLCFEYGSREEAMSAYENSLVIGERLAEKHSEVVEFAIAPSVAQERIARMYAELKENEKALPYFKKSLELRRQLAKQHPEDIRLMHDLATAYHNLASFNVQIQDKAESEFYLIKQNEVLLEIFNKQPMVETNIVGLLDTCISLGDFYFANQKSEKALASYIGALEKIKVLNGKQVGEPVLSRIANIHYKAGQVLLKKNDKKETYHHLSIALDIWSQLLKATNNHIYQQSVDNVKTQIDALNVNA